MNGEKGTWGFADAESPINLYWVDTYNQNDETDDKRISLHVNTNDGPFQGAHRCGPTRAKSYNEEGTGAYNFDGDSNDGYGEFELVFFHTNNVIS